MIPIDAIRIINLPHRADRRTAIASDLRRAFDAGVFPELPLEFVNRYPQHKTLVPCSWPHAASHWAAKREHEEVLNELWSSGSNLALILEDDALFLPSFYSDIVPFYLDVASNFPDWLALFLGGHNEYGFEPRSPRVFLNRGSRQSHAYIVNPSGMYRLLDHLWCQPFQFVDWSYADLMRNDACIYRPANWLVTTRAGWSDNRREMAKEGE
jgi:hypothetical protein